ncbi:MAG: hypothetical protein ACE5GG_00325 [Candidatus Omnitrophota bacterium]
MKKTGAMIWLIGLFWVAAVAADSLPLPPGANLVREETMNVDGGRRTVFVYEAGGRPEDVFRFYSRQLPDLGYRMLMENKKTIAYYLRGEEFLIIVANVAEPGKTSFVISRGEKPRSVFSDAGCKGISGVPEYPRAECVRSTEVEGRNMRSVSYQVSDEPAAVKDFYLTRMQRLGWKVENEMNFGDIGALHPMSPSGQPEGQGPLSGLGASFDLSGAGALSFVNLRGDKCTIMVMVSPLGNGSMIAVSYQDKDADKNRY